MVAVVKSEWHQVERRFGVDISRDLLEEIYPDMEPDELDLMYVQVEAGERDIEEILEDAWTNNIDIDWEWLDEDDMWTDRKGGYEVTYQVDATREFPTYTWTQPEPETEEEMFPTMDPDELTRRLDELKLEFDFMIDLEAFKNDESIHQEIRDAFVKIIEEEDMGI
jgi:hypothetical protein